jgi:hypothetical protein
MMQGIFREVELGPVNELRLEGPLLFANHEEKARYDQGAWDSPAVSASSIKIGEDCRLRLEEDESTQVIGPYSAVRITDGTINADQVRLCKFEPSIQKWILLSDSSCWSTVVIY